MILRRKRQRTIAVMTVATLLAGCGSTSVFKEETAAYSVSVDKSVDAFDALRRETQISLTESYLEDFAEDRVKIIPAGACGEVVESKLQRDARCLAEWSGYRANGSTGSAPGCVEPSGFYVLSATEERSNCRFGVLDEETGAVDVGALPPEAVLAQTAEIGAALKSYAGGLAKLAAAEDAAALKASLKDLTENAQSLSDALKAATDKALFDKSKFGPIADLISAGLTAGLEHRRLSAMRKIVAEADPVVNESAQYLSRASLPLVIPALREKANEISAAINAVNNARNESEYKAAYVKAEKARREYLSAYASHPSSAFEAMAKAHGDLAKALADPERQFAQMKQSLEDFYKKADAVAKAFKRTEE